MLQHPICCMPLAMDGRYYWSRTVRSNKEVQRRKPSDLRTLSAASVPPPDALLTCEGEGSCERSQGFHSAISLLSILRSSHLHLHLLTLPPTPPVGAYVTASNNATAPAPRRPLELRAAGGEQPVPHVRRCAPRPCRSVNTAGLTDTDSRHF